MQVGAVQGHTVDGPVLGGQGGFPRGRRLGNKELEAGEGKHSSRGTRVCRDLTAGGKAQRPECRSGEPWVPGEAWAAAQGPPLAGGCRDGSPLRPVGKPEASPKVKAAPQLQESELPGKESNHLAPGCPLVVQTRRRSLPSSCLSRTGMALGFVGAEHSASKCQWSSAEGQP